jgi:hypothetical protein
LIIGGTVSGLLLVIGLLLHAQGAAGRAEPGLVDLGPVIVQSTPTPTPSPSRTPCRIRSHYCGMPPVATPLENQPRHPAAGQTQAIRAARHLLQRRGFSRTGLVHRLQHDGFSTAKARYAVNHIRVDWGDQAIRAARDHGLFSQPDVARALRRMKFTPAQVDYAVATAFAPVR